MVPVSVALKVGVVPGIGLLFASLRVIVTVEVATPSAVTGLVPAINDWVAETGPGEKVTVADPVTPMGDVICRVFTSAEVEERVHDETPLVLVAEQAP